MDIIKVGNAIAYLRKKIGYTQKELADRIGVRVVTVAYEKMMIFDATVASYETAVTDLYTEWSSVTDETQIPSEEEMTDALLTALKDCMKDSIANAEYAEPDTTTIRIELVDNVWTPNSQDIENLEMLLFDTENANF